MDWNIDILCRTADDKNNNNYGSFHEGNDYEVLKDNVVHTQSFESTSDHYPKESKTLSSGDVIHCKSIYTKSYGGGDTAQVVVFTMPGMLNFRIVNRDVVWENNAGGLNYKMDVLKEI